MHAWHDDGVAWRTGAWAIERRDDELADLTYDGRIVVRSIRAVVRDRDWNTAAWRVGVVEADERMLRIPLTSHGYGSDLRGEVRAIVDGTTLTVTFDAVSTTAFETNRTGLVALHPPQLSGAELDVTHPDGAVSRTAFPRAISPAQPVFDIAALSWHHDGLAVRLEFSGDVFEMEDQRNWTDASFKTYSRPLSLPFPYPLAAGERVRQKITVAVEPQAPASGSAGAEVVTLAASSPFPTIGVAASSAPDPAPRTLPPIGDELVVELDLRHTNWRAALERAGTRGLPLDVRVVLDEPDTEVLAAFASALIGRSVVRVAVFHPYFHVSVAAFVDALRAALADAGIETSVVGGSRSHFTELGRERARMPDDLDALLVTVTPLFHSLSAAQLRESVAMQRIVAAQSVEYAAGRPVRIGPITLRPRFNDVATGPQPAPTRTDLTEGYGAAFTGAADERQSSSELAAWTVASAAALTVPGVAALTYFEEWGPRGVRAADGAPYPVAEALAALAELARSAASSGSTPDGRIWAIRTSTAMLVANLDLVTRRAVVEDRALTLAPLTWQRITP
jgi:D-apionolactonase